MEDKMDDVQMMLGDCLDKMSQIADGSVDMILCDLPYGTTANAWDAKIPLAPLWAQYWRLVKTGGAVLLFAQQPFAAELIQSNRKWFRFILKCGLGSALTAVGSLPVAPTITTLGEIL